MEHITVTASEGDVRVRKCLAGVLSLWAADMAAPAFGRSTTFQPIIGITQTGSFRDDDSAVTYTEIVAGFDASVDRPRLKGQVNYSYGKRFGEAGRIERSDRHDLTGRATMILAERRILVDAGGFAGLLNNDRRGRLSFDNADANNNLSQTFSLYVQPRLHADVGGLFVVDANYRYGWSNISGGRNDSATTSIGGLPPGAIPTDRASDSVNQDLHLALSNDARSSRLRWTLKGDGQREHAQRLDQRYRSYSAGIEFEYRVSRHVGLIATGGYESILSTQQNFLTDALGNPLRDADGDFMPDPAMPRREIYAHDGPTYEGGVIWTPSRRSSFQLRAGQRSGDFSVNGQARFTFGERLILNAYIRQGIESSGRLLTQNVAGIPTSFFVSGAQATGLGGCVFGTDAATGGCVADATQSLTDAQFRSTEAQIGVGGTVDRTNYSLAATYTRRNFFDPRQLQSPDTPALDPGLAQRSDTSIGATAQLSRQTGPRTAVSFNAFVNRDKFALQQRRDDLYFGGSASLSRAIGRRLQLLLVASANQRLSNDVEDTRSAQLTAGLRARF